MSPGDRSLRVLAAEGVAFAFGSQGAAVDPWGWVRRASEGDDAISARSAFTAATRGGHRAAREDSAGLLRPGAPATFAVWEFAGELVVRTPDERVAAWSTDPRAATPGLPDLDHGSPHCWRTVVDGAVVFDVELG
jgi:predicted amidohydrolase YtcJ